MSVISSGCMYTLSSLDNGRINLLSLRQSNGKACASTCLYVVARYWGIDKSLEQMENELGEMPKSGYAFRHLCDWAKANGLKAYVISGNIEDIRYQTQKGRPIIVILQKRKYKHSVVVKAVTMNGDILVMDPKKGKTVKFDQNKFFKQWQPLGNPMLIIAPAFDSTQKKA